ncbi:hypothetical protein LOTGIDRAFT_163153 [Lottia gigantea]|uniref:Tyr recombinase domain-containing protein n=1 Tax=Lottia gigantea TaxID=225164 RepID=V4AEL7_LOTGI|nr:hypothetical protein LOTGIDRAFT_163153 [Lottia gigantea]ESO91791.1 hypothetical protein LOTGIDRAFT_163153 [Lottia gigantea]
MHRQWIAPVGQNTLAKTVKRMCTAVGFEGFYTNHSLSATCAARLHQNGVEDQLIRRRTGHKSNAIDNYKRTSNKQDAMISCLVQGSRKRKLETCEEPESH